MMNNNKQTKVEKPMNEVYFHNQALIKAGAVGFEYNGEFYRFSDIVQYKGKADTVLLKGGTNVPFSGTVQVVMEAQNKAIGAW